MRKLINRLRIWCNTDNENHRHSDKVYNKNYIIGRIVILCVVMLGILAITGCGCGGCNFCGGCFDCFGCSNCFGCKNCSCKSDSCEVHHFSYNDVDYYALDNGCAMACGGKDYCVEIGTLDY